jgi:hypothetical protein
MSRNYTYSSIGQDSSWDHMTTQAPPLRQSRDTFGGKKLYFAGNMRPNSYTLQEVLDRATIRCNKYQTGKLLPLLYDSWILARHQDQIFFSVIGSESYERVLVTTKLPIP